jgi:hypothetical protein
VSPECPIPPKLERERVVSVRDYIEGPRWANIPSFLKKLCWEMDLELKLEVDKGWIRETVFFTVTGEHEVVELFGGRFRESIKAYNSRMST